ncbi:MAG: lipopolysaccharide biosynthesis protein [Bacteroidia bacterium]
MFKQLLSKSEFTKNTFILVIGTVIAQSIPLLLHPFLRRIYSPEDFGAMAVYLNIFGMLTIVSALRYEATIVLPKNNNEAANILSLTFIITLIFSTLLLLVLILFKDQIVSLINFPPQYSNYLYFLPFGCAAFSIYQSMNYWLIRHKAFKASTNNKIIRRAVEGSVQSILGLLKFPGGLFVGDVAGNMANVVAGTRQVFRNTYSTSIVTPRKIRFVLKKYIDYPKYNVLPTLLSSAATVLPFLFINKFYSTEVVGYLDLSRLVLSIPLIFISSTISQVFFQQTTEKKHQLASIKKDIRNIFYLLMAVVTLEIVTILFIGPWLFGFVFGGTYTISGQFSQILVFSFALNFIGSSFSSIFITFEKIRLNSVWQITYFCAICSLLLFKNLTIQDFLKVYVAIEVVMHSIYCGMMYFIVNRYEQSVKLKNR